MRHVACVIVWRYHKPERTPGLASPPPPATTTADEVADLSRVEDEIIDDIEAIPARGEDTDGPRDYKADESCNYWCTCRATGGGKAGSALLAMAEVDTLEDIDAITAREPARYQYGSHGEIVSSSDEEDLEAFFRMSDEILGIDIITASSSRAHEPWGGALRDADVEPLRTPTPPGYRRVPRHDLTTEFRSTSEEEEEEHIATKVTDMRAVTYHAATIEPGAIVLPATLNPVERNASCGAPSCDDGVDARVQVLVGFHRGRQRLELLGGKMDRQDASIQATAIREIEEEASIVVEPSAIQYIWTEPDPTSGSMVSVFTANVGGTVEAQCSDEHEVLKWASMDRAMKMLPPHNAAYIRRWHSMGERGRSA